MSSINKLKYFRNRAGFTQESLAKASGISIRTIQRIEKNLSKGSSYTLNKLAEVLKTEPSNLLNEEGALKVAGKTNASYLTAMNLSALSVILIPLGNLFFPLYIFLTNKEEKQSSHQARKILSFQLLWLLTTLLLMILTTVFVLIKFGHLGAFRMPLSVPIYAASVVINVFFIIHIAVRIKEGKEILNFVPDLF